MLGMKLRYWLLLSVCIIADGCAALFVIGLDHSHQRLIGETGAPVGWAIFPAAALFLFSLIVQFQGIERMMGKHRKEEAQNLWPEVPHVTFATAPNKQEETRH